MSLVDQNTSTTLVFRVCFHSKPESLSLFQTQNFCYKNTPSLQDKTGYNCKHVAPVNRQTQNLNREWHVVPREEKGARANICPHRGGVWVSGASSKVQKNLKLVFLKLCPSKPK